MTIHKSIPIGIENFKEMIDKDYYFVDKTNFINDVINEKVALYTRPRRFGKTLNMSMLYYFFSNKEKANAYLFDGLEISHDKEALKHQNQYPVIFLSLKEMRALSFDQQISMYSLLVYYLVNQNLELLDSPFLEASDKNRLKKYYDISKDIVDLKDSLKFLSQCLEKHYHQKVIILIDEYDVPLQDAYLNGYYDEMVDFLRGILSAALKTNDALEKGVLTGCLRIAKESIFTGLNNFNVYSIFELKSSQAFGFTPEETEKILNDYQFDQAIPIAKEWYDGYLFGHSEIYNPWSILNYVNRYLQGQNAPESFWANTSGNDLVKIYIQESTPKLRAELEQLVNGQSINKHIKPELTYLEMNDVNNIYSFMLFTGYLKAVKKTEPNTYDLKIPNKEVQIIFTQTFQEWFKAEQNKKTNDFIEALLHEDVMTAGQIINETLWKSMSFFDEQEGFYHGFLLGMLSDVQNHSLKSNRESGDGRFDIALIPFNWHQKGIVIECKKSQSIREMDQDCKEALQQIIDKKYIEGFLMDGYTDFSGYGISFYKKHCKIIKL